MIETENILTESLTHALEQMAFLTILPPDENIVAPETITLAEISFTGPKTGTIQILAGLDLCKILAENIAALKQVNEETCYDALKELSNVTCGLLLPELADSPADVFDITIPIIKNEEDCPNWNEFVEQQNISILNIEGYLVATRLIMKN